VEKNRSIAPGHPDKNKGHNEQDKTVPVQKDRSSGQQQDKNGNLNGTLNKTYKTEVIYQNPFHGNDDGVASTLM
jgi:hypothetical protein